MYEPFPIPACRVEQVTRAGPERFEIGVRLSLEPKRTLSFGCPKEFFGRIGIMERPALAPQDRIRDAEAIASQHVEMLAANGDSRATSSGLTPAP